MRLSGSQECIQVKTGQAYTYIQSPSSDPGYPGAVGVGGEVAPVDRAGVLTLWIGLALILALAIGGGSFVLVRRRSHK